MVTGVKTKPMAMALTIICWAQHMWATGSTTCSKAKAERNGKMARSTRACSIKDKNMGKATISGQMAASTKDSGSMVNDMGPVC